MTVGRIDVAHVRDSAKARQAALKAYTKAVHEADRAIVAAHTALERANDVFSGTPGYLRERYDDVIDALAVLGRAIVRAEVPR
jgi:hypothetical protein